MATLFLLSIFLDNSQPTEAPAQTYTMLVLYVGLSAIIAVLTWRNWWLDARLAGAAHLADITVFTMIVFSTNGYTSPFFLFFVLPLLSAAIRWGWRETALTALVLVLIYLAAGVLSASGVRFELQRFVVRSSHLVILSTMLIWFGIHQRSTRLFFGVDDFNAVPPEEADAREGALRLAMQEAGAARGILLLQAAPDEPLTGLVIDDNGINRSVLERPLLSGPPPGALLFDCDRKRTLTHGRSGHSQFGRGAVIEPAAAAQLSLTEGVIAPVRTGTADGWLVLEGIAELSTDYLELAPELAAAVGAVLERAALIGAVQESAGARARLTLARDVHDSIVQFLAGATIRVEAMSRAEQSGADLGSDLAELKRLLVDEQRDIREFISAVRHERTVGLGEVMKEMRALGTRLTQQWGVTCTITSKGTDVPIPPRLQIDLQQLLREGVANAVRHGGATEIRATIESRSDELRLEMLDNGTGFANVAAGTAPPEPWSLKDRIDRAKGSLMLVSEAGRTQVLISLPLPEAQA